MDQGRNEVRVMTVHGAKGLEAEIVFMPDTCATPGGAHDPALLELPLPNDGPKLLLWPVRKKDEDDVSAIAREGHRRVQADEYRRLLYVAMTRARDRLYVAGYRGVNPPPPDCWYELVCEALLPEARQALHADGGTVWRIEGRQQRKPESETEAAGEPPRGCFRTGRDAPPSPSRGLRGRSPRRVCRPRAWPSPRRCRRDPAMRHAASSAAA